MYLIVKHSSKTARSYEAKPNDETISRPDRARSASEKSREGAITGVILQKERQKLLYVDDRKYMLRSRNNKLQLLSQKETLSSP